MINDKIVINFCPTGMVPTTAQTPFVPIAANDIIEQTHAAFELGITIAHLHARNADETPAWQPELYAEIVEGLRKHCPGLVLCLSTSGRKESDFAKRSAVIELMPDMCSLTLSSLNFLQSTSVNTPDTIQQLASKMLNYGVHPELECFDLGMINYGKYLIAKSIIQGPIYWNLLFGNIAGFQPELHHISAAVHDIPAGDFIGLGGLGSSQLKVNALAIAMGYGVRVGIEDNIWWDTARTRLATNLELLKRIHGLMECHGRQILSAVAFGEAGFYNTKNAYITK